MIKLKLVIIFSDINLYLIKQINKLKIKYYNIVQEKSTINDKTSNIVFYIIYINIIINKISYNHLYNNNIKNLKE